MNGIDPNELPHIIAFHGCVSHSLPGRIVTPGVRTDEACTVAFLVCLSQNSEPGRLGTVHFGTWFGS